MYVTFLPAALPAVQRGAKKVTPQVAPQVMGLLGTLTGEMSRGELMENLGLKDRKHFSKGYLQPALDTNKRDGCCCFIY